ncbi:hypothetical protein [Streptomyces violaceusniger]|uniref:Uncharacterized protein n=1 Tax=Streptomyces violaceusniger (strain Tu 4113) TaxID=653045 RepID=G2NTU1_STRV4|nr:hypothetical protein [Streptomyces violaceusniger]AEM83601.1 hypothetical protein Strvi_3941 [Streptomyces violaceusniger Tu 4113]
MPIDVYAAMRAMMRAEATRRPVTPQARTTDPSPPPADPAAPDPADATARDVAEAVPAPSAVPAPTSVPAPSAAPRPVRRSRPARYLSRCRAVLRAVRHTVSSCITGRASRQGR